MKHAWHHLLASLNDKQEAAYMRTTILMIFLFLSFFGATFYVMIASFG